MLRESLEFDIKNLDGKVILKAGEKLAGADLREANLRETDLRWANLKETDLEGADLSRTDLRWADLEGVNLSRANLSRANLERVKLKRADLKGADLWGADLERTDLEGVNLREADLEGVNLRGTDLKEVDLKRADLTNTIGNGKEIYTIQTEVYTINLTKDTIQIGCKQHTREEWYSFSDEEIEAMGGGKALKFWFKYKPIIQSIDQGLFKD